MRKAKEEVLIKSGQAKNLPRKSQRPETTTIQCCQLLPGEQLAGKKQLPLLKCGKTIDDILDGKSKHANEAKDYCSVLTFEEECLLVRFLVNKGREYQPYNRKDITQYV